MYRDTYIVFSITYLVLALSIQKTGSGVGQQTKRRKKGNCKTAVSHRLHCFGQNPADRLTPEKVSRMKDSKCSHKEIKLLLELAVVLSISPALPLVAAGAPNTVLQDKFKSGASRQGDIFLPSLFWDCPQGSATSSCFVCPCGKAAQTWLQHHAEAQHKFRLILDLYLCNCCECITH